MNELNWNPSRRELRTFAAIAVVVFGALGAWLSFSGREAAWLFAATGLVIGVPGLIHPPSIRLIYVLLALLTRPIGWALSHLIIAVLFYALITPLGLLRRLLGRDPLALRAALGADSYWAQRPPPDDGSSYLRQS